MPLLDSELMTPQEEVLYQMRSTYGKTAYTEDTLRYKLVGFKRDEKKLFAIGNSWQQAIDGLEKRAAK